jgi:hypothetical protein
VSSASPPAHVGPTGAPVVASLPKAGMWLVLGTLFALIVYYFVGVDQGAASLFGSDHHIHEFVHDARHFLGFPCH